MGSGSRNGPQADRRGRTSRLSRLCVAPLALGWLAYPALAHAQEASAGDPPAQPVREEEIEAAAPGAPAAAPATATDVSVPPSSGNGAPAADVQTFLPADFARFTPRTALDMVRNIPNFQIQGVSSDRGLGQASGNILINGQRVSGKSADPESVLGSIAASSVERIEVTEGSRLNIPGLTGRVANVVVTGGRLSGQFSWQPEFRRIGENLLPGSISVSGRIGASDISVSLATTDGFLRGGQVRERVTDAAGNLLTVRNERDVFSADVPRLTASLRRLWADGTLVNLNLAGGLFYFDNPIIGRSFDVDTATVYDERFNGTEREWNAEVGGDIEFDLAGGRLKLIGLQRFEHSPVEQRFVETPVGGATSGSRFRRVADEGESVVRAEFGWRGAGDWQVGTELAYNFLDNRSELFSIHGDGSETPIPLAGGTVFVDEWRAELLLTRSWPLAQGLTAQATVGGEYSRLRQAGPDGQTRNFLRPKGTLTLAWTLDPQTTVNVTAERAVGQLSFFDFAASVDLDNGNNNAGNVDLVPEQRWDLSAEVVRSLGSLGSLTVGAYHQWITDIVDQVPLSATTEGVGNLPNARRWGVYLTSTLQLDSLGLPGVRLDLSGELDGSRVRDPVTLQPRPISESDRYAYSIAVRHDIANTALAWGGSLQEERGNDFFRLDQVRRGWLDRPVAELYVEHKDLLGLTVRFAMRNMLDARDLRERDVYAARRDGPVAQLFRLTRDIRPFARLTISGSF